jgi:hypothetical protein
VEQGLALLTCGRKIAPALDASVPALPTRERRALSRTDAARLVRGEAEVADTLAPLFIDLSSPAGISFPHSKVLFLLDPTIPGSISL